MKNLYLSFFKYHPFKSQQTCGLHRFFFKDVSIGTSFHRRTAWLHSIAFSMFGPNGAIYIYFGFGIALLGSC